MLITVGDRERGLAWPYLLRRIDAMEGLAGDGCRHRRHFRGPAIRAQSRGDASRATPSWRGRGNRSSRSGGSSASSRRSPGF